MKDIKTIVANNLITLRKSKKMTQADVAEKLNYSDKSVSKWEHADSLPDISILYALADMYGVTLDYLTSDNAEEQANMLKTPEKSLENDRIIIASLTVTSVFLIAALVFVYIYLNAKISSGWIAFVWALPVSFAALTYYNRIWTKNKIYAITLKSLLLWTLLAAICLQFMSYRLWLIFVLGVPLQLIILLTANLTPKKKREKDLSGIKTKGDRGKSAAEAETVTVNVSG